MKTNSRCKDCGKRGLEITYVDDSMIEGICPHCEEEFCVEPDGLGGGMGWACAMAAQEAGEL
ncbi:MAG: hypothetical protein NUV65_00800 [Candidatus Roizmanbacteria bacterium]|nr:hypothetical protein [Candidatus Roizmanbacteria bacterium]